MIEGLLVSNSPSLGDFLDPPLVLVILIVLLHEVKARGTARGGEAFHSLPGLELVHAYPQFWLKQMHLFVVEVCGRRICVGLGFRLWLQAKSRRRTNWILKIIFVRLGHNEAKDRDIDEGEEINICSFAFFSLRFCETSLDVCAGANSLYTVKHN